MQNIIQTVIKRVNQRRPESNRKRTKSSSMSMKTRDTLTAYLFLSPAIVGFLVFMLFPFIFSLILAFTSWDLVSGIKGIKFVGLDNFVKLFASNSFKTALRNNITITVTCVPITLVISLSVAYILNEKIYLMKTARLLYFIPYICNIVAASVVFKCLFRTDGPINNMLLSLGFNEVPRWLGDTKLALIPIIVLTIWMGIGYDMVIYMAALQNVPKSLYEAGELDGAVGVKRFLYITIPMLSPTTYFLIVTRMIAAFQVFSAIKVMTEGGLGTSVLVYEIYKEAFIHYKFGYGSAIAWILFLVIMAITLLQMATEKKWVTYS